MAFTDYLNDRGKATSEALWGTWQRPSATDQADPEYQELVANFVHNGMYSREVVDRKTRQLIAVGCLTALYRPDQLRSHIRAGLRLASPEEVREAILQAGVYGGFPSTMSALGILAEVMNEPKPE